MNRRNLLKGLLAIPALFKGTNNAESKTETNPILDLLNRDDIACYTWPGSPKMQIFLNDKEIENVITLFGSYSPSEETQGAVEILELDSKGNCITICSNGIEFVKKKWFAGKVRWEHLYNDFGYDNVCSYAQTENEFHITSRIEAEEIARYLRDNSKTIMKIIAKDMRR